MPTADDIMRICRLHLDEGETERLVAWIAWRVDRPVALAGDRPSPERLRHVVTHWLSEGERSALTAWLARRIALREPVVPAPRDGAPRSP